MFISVDLEWFLHSSSPRYQSNMRLRGRETYGQWQNHSIHLQRSQSLLLLLETIINKALILSSYSCIMYLSDYIYFLILKLHLFTYVWAVWGEQTQLERVSSILPPEPQTHGSGHEPRTAQALRSHLTSTPESFCCLPCVFVLIFGTGSHM